MELGRVRAGLVRSAVALFVLLAVTGVWLSFFYRPTAPEVDLSWVTGFRGIHRWSSVVVVFVLVALLVVCIAEVTQRRATNRHWAIAAVLLVCGVFLGFTGYLLPWDQLALWAVTVGTNYTGFFSLFGDEVRYVLVAGVEVGTGTVRAWFVVHALLLPLVFGALMWRLRRRTAVAPREEVKASV